MIDAEFLPLNVDMYNSTDINAEANCNDSIDNDGDNFFDCQDYDCCNHTHCREQNSGCE